jgi:hypothetical protein
MSNRQYAAVRNAKIRRAAQHEADEQTEAARRGALIVGMCPTCGADRVDGEDHAFGCPEAR